jgi:flagellar hook assembly protein FlgD
VVAQESQVVLRIYNLQGKEIKTLINDFQIAGSKSVVWDGTDASGRSVSSGVYVYRLQAGDFVESRQMILLK